MSAERGESPVVNGHSHAVAVAAMEWRDLLACLEQGCDHWSAKALGTALFFKVAGMEFELRDLRRREGQDAGRLSNALRALINLAPANSRRKTVATADVQAIWMEARG